MIPPQSFLVSLTILLASPVALAGLVQKPGLALPPGSQDKRDAVEKIFTASYESYRQNAFRHDNLQPISKTASDGRNGWGASIIDAMSTMYIMGKDEFFEEAVDFVCNKVNFNTSQTSDTVSVFETTIRYLGGMLSAYELSGKKHQGLLDKAKQVADKMTSAWIDGNDIPFGHLDFNTSTPSKDTSNIAEAGTLTLEWATLSKFTGNDIYRQLAEKSALRIANQPAPLPGLPAQGIDPSTGAPVGGYVTWGGGSDSYFEYLIKYARLNNAADPKYVESWRTAVDSSIKTLLKTSTYGEHVYLADYLENKADPSKSIRHVGSHLACFHGGNWLFGGRLLNNDTIVNIGLQLVDGCWNTYAGTTTGIGPEAFAYTSSDGFFTGSSTPPTPGQLVSNKEHGFYITSSAYVLRPEVLESNFYAWRVTGDTKYLDRAAMAIKSFNQFLSVNGAFAGLYNVDSKNSERIDDMESFWFAEVLKYLYLTFDDPSHISLDEYVFSTEGHLFKLPSPNASFGGGGSNTPAPAKRFHDIGSKLPQAHRRSLHKRRMMSH